MFTSQLADKAPTSYSDLKADSRVESVRFVGGGIGVVTLADGFINDGKTVFYAWCERVAVEFVAGANAMQLEG